MKNIIIKFVFSIVLFSHFILFPSLIFASPITEDNILNQLNLERQKSGLNKLKIDTNLSQAAKDKSQDMINRNYFDHFAFGLTPWTFIKNSGYDYLYAGENLAMDFYTSEGMVKAWMSSADHRKNILNPYYEDTGLGIVKGDYTENGSTHSTYMVTNLFGKKRPTILKVFDYITGGLTRLF